MTSAELRAITGSDIPEVSRYIARVFDTREAQVVRRLEWAEATDPPNLGFLLRASVGVVGIFTATYSTTPSGHQVCHLGGWHVEEAYRAQSLALFRAFLKGPYDVFTDYTPVPHVRPINQRLGFVDLDTRSTRIWNARIPLRRRGIRLVSAPDEAAALLTGRDRKRFEDHRSVPDLHQLVLRDGDARCHVLYRRERGRTTRARILYVSDIALFRASASQVLFHILVKHRSLFTVAELRTIGGPIRFSRSAPAIARQVRTNGLPHSEAEYDYSSLIWVE